MTAIIRRILSPLAATALLFTTYSCKQADEEITEKNAGTNTFAVHFVAGEIETRTVFSDAQTADGITTYPTLWSANDSLVAVSLNYGTALKAAVIPSSDRKSATFDAEFSSEGITAPYTFYAMSPSTAALGISQSHKGYRFGIPAVQTPSATSCDESAQILAASREVGSTSGFSAIMMQFHHVTAYGRMTLRNLAIPAGATLQSVDLTASTPFAGQFYYDYETGAVTAYAASRTITIDLSNVTPDGNGQPGDIWFACAPADLGGGSLKVEVGTSAGTFTKTVEIGTGRLAFSSGRISRFSIDMSGADLSNTADRWLLVTDASTLADGDEIIIANSATEGEARAMSTTQYTEYRGYTSVTIAAEGDDVVILNPGTAVERLVLVDGTGTYAGCFRLKDATSASEGYLVASNNGSTNTLTTGASDNGYSNWRIGISGGAAVISTYGTVSKSGSTYYRHIRYNETSPRFSTYRSSSRTEWINSGFGQNDVYIYRKGVVSDNTADAVLQQDAYGAYLAAGSKLFSPGSQMSREYAGDGTLTFAILTPATLSVSEFSGIPTDPAKGDTFTLGFKSFSKRDLQPATYYNVTVLKVDGPKVWLSDGAGNGFIVKK